MKNFKLFLILVIITCISATLYYRKFTSAQQNPFNALTNKDRLDKKDTTPILSVSTQNASAVHTQDQSDQANISAPYVSAVTTAAVQNGVLTCTARINQVMSYLTGNTKSGAYLFVSPQQPSEHIFSSS